MNSSPKITTPETEHLRSLYPALSHLEAGRVTEWLSERKDQLLEQAQIAEAEADTVRVLGLLSAGVGTICYAVNPFMLVGGMIGGAAWLWFIVEHYDRTKEIAPLPFVRGNFLDALSRVGDYDARQDYRINHLADTIKFLPRRDAQEYVFLYSDYFETVIDYLIQVEPGKRFYAYRWLLSCFEKFSGRSLPDKQSLNDHLKNVVVDSRINSQEVTAIQESINALNFVSLLESVAEPQVEPFEPSSTSELQQIVTEQEIVPPDTKAEGEISAFKIEEMSSVTMDSLLSKGGKFVDTLCNTTLSCIFLGIPGTGKTTILGVAIGRMRRKHGENFKVEMIAMKGDKVLNIHPIVFYQYPESAFDAIYRALTEHRRRSRMPKEERLAYAKNNPYRVIIDDYTSQQQKLDGIFKDLPIDYGVDSDGNPREVKLPLAYEDALNELWFNGRETNVGVWVGTHSEVLNDLRFVSSKSGRSSGLLCFLGRRDKLTSQGHYDIVSGNLKHFIVPDKQHLASLKAQFPKAVELAYEKDKPLALISGIDNGSFGLAIIPDLTEEYQRYLGSFEVEQVDHMDFDPDFDNLSNSQSSTSSVEESVQPFPGKVEKIEEAFEEKNFSPYQMTAPQLKTLITRMKAKSFKQTQIITVLWDVEPGGAKNPRWQKAREEYRAIMGE